MVPVTRPRSLQRAAKVFGESPVGGSGDGDGVCLGLDVRARGLFRGFVCVFVVCSKCVRARGWLLQSACLSGFRCACMCLKEVCARVPPVWRVCASTGSVLVAWELCLSSHAIGCVLWSVRACGVLHSTLPLLFDWCLRESTCVGVCVCGRPGAALRCFPLVSVWLREDTRWLILRLPAHRSVRLCLF